MSSTRTLAAPLILAALLLPTACLAPGAKVQFGYMQPSLTGQIGLSPSSGSTGPVLRADVENSLGLEESASTALLRAELDAGPVRVMGSAFRYAQTGSGTLDANFGDLSAGVQVDSDLELTNVKLALTFDLLDTGVFRLSPGIGADVFQVKARVTETSTGAFEDIDELTPVPMVFLQAAAGLGPISAEVTTGYLDINSGDADGTYFDLEAIVSFNLASTLELNAGYRYIAVDAQGSSGGQDLTADLVLEGWFVGGGIRF